MLAGSVVGAIIGPFIGAIIGEMVHDDSDAKRAIKVGIGSFLSFLVGTGLKLILSFAMLFKILGDIFPVVRDWFAGLIAIF